MRIFVKLSNFVSMWPDDLILWPHGRTILPAELMRGTICLSVRSACLYNVHSCALRFACCQKGADVHVYIAIVTRV